MKISKVLLILMVLVIGAISAVYSSSVQDEKEAVKKAALDYIEGMHSGDGARTELSLHHEVNKAMPFRMGQEAKTVLRYQGFSLIREMTDAKAAFLPEEKRQIEITVFDIKEGLAAVRAKSAVFTDHLLMADIDGEWKIIHILGKQNTPADDAKDRDETALRQKATSCALDYIEGAYSGDVERMTRAVHPELTKVIPVVLPQTKKTALNRIGAGILIEGTQLKMGLLPEEKRNIEVEIFDLADGMAVVRVLSAMYYDYLQIADFDGEWKIVNVLWKMNPGARSSK